MPLACCVRLSFLISSFRLQPSSFLYRLTAQPLACLHSNCLLECQRSLVQSVIKTRGQSRFSIRACFRQLDDTYNRPLSRLRLRPQREKLPIVLIPGSRSNGFAIRKKRSKKKFCPAGRSSRVVWDQRCDGSKLETLLKMPRMRKSEIHPSSFIIHPCYDGGVPRPMTKRARRFFAQHSSVDSLQAGISLP
jgi:hypothetical protein